MVCTSPDIDSVWIERKSISYSNIITGTVIYRRAQEGEMLCIKVKQAKHIVTRNGVPLRRMNKVSYVPYDQCKDALNEDVYAIKEMWNNEDIVIYIMK